MPEAQVASVLTSVECDGHETVLLQFDCLCFLPSAFSFFHSCSDSQFDGEEKIQGGGRTADGENLEKVVLTFFCYADFPLT